MPLVAIDRVPQRSPRERGSVSIHPDLTVVVPVHNSQRHVAPLTDQLVTTSTLSIEVILVDDCSTDASGAAVDDAARHHSHVTAVHLPSQKGAGVARNVGFGYATGRYTLFFDVDDIIHTRALHQTISALDSTNADVAILSYLYQRGPDRPASGMVSHDVDIFGRYITGSGITVTTLDKAPKLLELTNYPWNKILRTDRYRDVGLRFGSTPVHNDILGHWQALLGARSILLTDDAIATHVVHEGEGNLTNRRGESRLTLFDALDETYSFLEQRPPLRQHYASNYWSFAARTVTWAEQRILPEFRETYRMRRREHMTRIDLGDFVRLRRRRDPALADTLITMSTL